MKQLTSFQRANAGNPPELPPPRTPAVSRSAPLLEAPTGDSQHPAEHGRLPTVGVPLAAGGSYRSGNSSVRREGDTTWGPSEKLSWQLSYGGQIGLWSGRHHDYSQWPRTPALFSGRSS